MFVKIGTKECKTPNITLMGNVSNVDSPMKFVKSKSFTVLADVEDNCQTSDRVKLDWFLSNKAGEFFGKLIRVGKRDSPRLDIKERSLDYGVYFLKIEATMKNQRIRNYAFGFFEIVPSNLIAKITSGNKIFWGVNKTVTFNAFDSFDPDILPSTTEGLRFQWFCRREGERSPQDFSSFPVLIIDKNKKDVGGCYGNGPRRINSTSGTASLNASLLELGVTYVVELQVMKDNRVARTAHTFKVTKPKLYIQIR